MNCRDFDQIWNRLLDAESGPRRDDGPEAATSRLAREAELREHAESCPPCLLKHRQFETLRTAMRVWADRPDLAPAVAPDFVDRVVRAAASAPAPVPISARPSGGTRRLTWASGLAAAAMGLVLLRPGFRPEPRPEAPAPASLSVAMADARAASWRLAQTASEPAARLGLAMLDASLADESPTPTPEDESEGVGGGEETPGPDAPGLVDRVGGYAAAGARPLSDAARRAFGFLRSPSLEKTVPAAAPRGT